MNFKTAKTTLRAIGITLTKKQDEYRVNLAEGGTEDSAYYTDNLLDAIGTGQHMAKQRDIRRDLEAGHGG